MNHHTAVQGGVMAGECGLLLSDFFALRRAQQKRVGAIHELPDDAKVGAIHELPDEAKVGAIHELPDETKVGAIHELPDETK